MRIQVTLNRIEGAWGSPRSWLFLAAVTAYLGLVGLFLPGEGGGSLAGFRLPPCPFRALSGLPCPYCGLTAGSARALAGEWRLAWDSNILSPFLVLSAFVLAGYTIAFRLLSGRAMRVKISVPGDWPWLLFGTLTAVSWIVNLFRR